MHLVLAPRRRLADLYGPGYPALAAALDAALAARAAAGALTHAYDPEAGLPELAIAPCALEPAPIIDQLRAIAAALAERGTIVASLWIIGGPQALPFARLPNPMPDRDGDLLSDWAYGLADARELLAQWPVGRTPDADPIAPGLLAGLLGRVAAAHRAGPRPPAPMLALAAARWRATTAAVIELAGAQAETLLTPPFQAGGLLIQRLAAARLIYCNLHGVRGAPDWFGQAPNDTELLAALRPADLAGIDLDGAALISQACFGARLGGADDQEALAVALLRAGAAALIAPLVLSYGAIEPPPGESDLLAAALIAALREPAVRLGDAVLSAHAATLRRVLTRRGAPDADDVKTLLSFLLYGDPALAWAG